MDIKFGRKEPRFYPTQNGMVPSATTVLSVLNKPMLMPWAANCAVDYVIDNSDVNATLSGELGTWKCYDAYCHILDEARTAYKRESKESMNYGTYIHTLCKYYFETGTEIESPHEMTDKLMKSFYVWYKKHSVVPLETETAVYGDSYAGRVDLVCLMRQYWMSKKWCENNGYEWHRGIEKERTVILIDFKTGKGSYYTDWPLQIAGYRKAVPFDLNHHGILKFNKETMKVNFKCFSPSYENDYKSFMDLVRFYWRQNQWKGKNENVHITM